MIFLPSSKEAASYSNRYAMAVYNMGGGGHPPRNGLIHNQTYVGQILDGGRFHVLKPDRMCCTTEFVSFQLVSRGWSKLTELERSLLCVAYSQKKLALDSLSSDVAAVTWNEVASRLYRAGYLRWTDELQVVELTLVGEAEVEHRLFNRNAAEDLTRTDGGIRIQHHGVKDHEIDLGRSSTLAINVDGMLISILTLPGSGAVVRIDHDGSHRVYMNHTDEYKRFAQVYIDNTAAPPANILSENTGENQMENKRIYITELDAQRLKDLLDHPDLVQQKPYLQKLEQEIERAFVVPATKVSANTVTMNSTVQLTDVNTKEEMIFTLVYPDQANVSEGKISVLAPIGTAILGCSEGDVVEWEVPDGIQTLKVDRIIYQPEAAGNYAL